MIDSSQARFPSIPQSVLLIFIILIVQHQIPRLFQFIQNSTLVTLLASILNFCLLLFFLRYMEKNNHIENLGSKIKRMNGVVLLSGVLTVSFLYFFPMSEISLLSSDQLKKITSDYTENKRDLFTFIHLCLLVPVFEELVYRGVVLGGLLKRYSPLMAISVSSVLFAILHMTIVDPLVFGLLLGWIFYKTQNLLYCIIIHISVNTLAFALRYLVYKEIVSLEGINQFIDSNLFLYCGILGTLVVACIYALHIRFEKYELN